MDQKTMIAVAIVAIVLVAGVAAAVVMNGDGSDDRKIAGDSVNSEGRLTIFGNANNDDYIDSRDVDYVKAIIAGTEEPVYFDCYKSYGGESVKRTFADANCDGKIDESDVKWIQRMVDREQDMLVYYYDVDSVIASCTYPLTTLAVGYKSNFEAVLICGAADRCLYACDQVANNGTYSQWYSAFSNAKNMGNRFNPDYEVFYKEGNEVPGCMVTGTRAWYDPSMEEKVAPRGIDVVRLPFWEDNIATSGIITLGYLLGNETEAYEYMEQADSVVMTIQDHIENIPLKDRPFVAVFNNALKIQTLHNGVQEGIWLAGGKCPLDMGYTAGGTIDEEGLYDMNPDYIVFRLDFGLLGTFESHDATMQKMCDSAAHSDGKYLDVADKTGAYAKGNIMFINQGIFMGPASYIAVAYMAETIYDGLDFDVDGLFKEYIEKYHPDYTFEDMEGFNYYSLKDLQDYFA